MKQIKSILPFASFTTFLPIKHVLTVFTFLVLGKVPEVDLPDGWIGVAHQTGGIIYMHKTTRVVTWSRPYQIGRNASLRVKLLIIFV